MTKTEMRGRAIARTPGAIIRKGNVFAVMSQSKDGLMYLVNFARRRSPRCNCKDHIVNMHRCKHICAVAAYLETHEPEEVPQKAPHPPRIRDRDWKTYNRTCGRMESDCAALLAELLKYLPEVPRAGRRGHDPADLIYGAVVAKIMPNVGSRYARVDDLAKAGEIDEAFHFNAFSRLFNRPATTVYLDYLIDETARLLGEFEESVSWDSSGFSTTQRGRWCSEKWGMEYLMERAEWVKMHIAIGNRTHVVAAIDISADSGKGSGDSPHMRLMMPRVKRNFPLAKFGSADKAYLSHANLVAAEKAGIEMFIRPKSNTTGKRSERIRNLQHRLAADPDRFERMYGDRENVESTFASMKVRFAEDLMSKNFIAQVNEAMFIALCHNLECVVRAIHNMGIAVPWLSTADGLDTAEPDDSRSA